MTITTTQMKQLSDANSQGVCMGQSAADLIGFYGTAPIIQRSGASQAAVSTTTIAPVVYTTPTAWTDIIPYLTSTVAAVNLLVTRNASNYTLANELRASMLALGLIAGA